MESQVCSLLGLIDERGAYLTYPSYENRCYATTPHDSIPLNEQTFFCLGGNRERCPRFQALQARQSGAPSPAKARPETAAAGAAALAASAVPGADEAVGDTTADDGLVWTAGDGEPLADDWEAPEPAWASPPPPAPYGRSRRPVWPLLLAAGTLVVVLMLCGLLGAVGFGWRALSAQLALNPSATAVIEQGTVIPGGLPITATVTPAGVIVVVASETPQVGGIIVVPPTATAAPTSTASQPGSQLPTATPTPVLPPTSVGPPTPTFTPQATPTRRDTPTNAPPRPTNTPTNIPPPTATFTPAWEPFAISFSANPTTVNAGQIATLSWSVTGVREIYLDGDAVAGPTGSRRVQPGKTTTYVLRVVKRDWSVQEETVTVTVNVPPTATATPTPTATPFYQVTMGQNRTDALIDGTGCQTGNGCDVFKIQIINSGNRSSTYRFSKVESLPAGWSSSFCWGSQCEYVNPTRNKEVAANDLQNVSLNLLLPSYLSTGQTGTIHVTGTCVECEPQQVYEQVFNVEIFIPTPVATGTATHTPTPTPTATVPASRGLNVNVVPFPLATTNGSGCYNAPDGCAVFDVTVTNTGSGLDYYRAQVLPTSWPPTWSARICTASQCYSSVTDSRTLNAGAQESLKVRLFLSATPTPNQEQDLDIKVYLTNPTGPEVIKSVTIRYVG